MVYKVCAYTLWSVLEINTSFRRLRREEYGDWFRMRNTSSPILSSPSFGFLGPSRPDLVMHRLADVDMRFLWLLWDV